MARMHARRRGKSCSVRPYRKQAPAWSNIDAKAITKVILNLRKEGASSSKIGLVLRDSHGVPDVKLALGKRIGDVLKENKVASEIPEDLRDLMIKALGLRKHLGENKKDLHNKRQAEPDRVKDPTSCAVLPGNKETAQGVRLQAGDRRNSAVQIRNNRRPRYPCPLNPSQKRLQNRSAARNSSRSMHTMMQTA